MTPEDIALIRHSLPDDLSFPYYTDRESAWLAAHLMAGDSTVAALKSGPAAKLLARPVLHPLVAAGGGRVAHRDVLALAHADRAIGWTDLSAAARDALEQIFTAPWSDFRLSLTSWGTGPDWQWNQLSRKGGNLVLQMGFPADHAELMGRYLARDSRKAYECDWHPIRTEGCPTLAWARLDVDLESGTALIEEIQSDWLRELRWEVEYLQRHAPRSRELRQKTTYEARLRDQYERLWPRAMLLAALVFLHEELGCHRIFLHQPDVGAALKRISGGQPPRSLYTSLPRRFCFEPVRDAPGFLAKERVLRKLAKRPGPLFWSLAL